jgi:hypothetical protein
MAQFYGYKIKSLEEIKALGTSVDEHEVDHYDWEYYFIIDEMAHQCGKLFAKEDVIEYDSGHFSIDEYSYISEWTEKVYVMDGSEFDFRENKDNIVKVKIKSVSEIEKMYDVDEGDRFDAGPCFIANMWQDCGKVLNFNRLTEGKGYIRCVNHMWSLHPDWVYVYYTCNPEVVVEEVAPPAEPLVEYVATPEEFRAIKGTLGSRVSVVGYKTLPFPRITRTLSFDRKSSDNTCFPAAMEDLCDKVFTSDESHGANKDRVKLGGYFWVDGWYSVIFTVA